MTGRILAVLALAACGGPSGDKPAPDCADPGTWYTDTDGDGYGARGSGVEACEQPDDAVENGSDCDDDASDVRPGAPELCNGVDDDCDDLVDDADDGLQASERAPWYEDADGDGHGAGDVAFEACAAGEGYAASDADCDDGDAEIYPGRSEICSDGIDNDCDGGSEGCGWTGVVDAEIDRDGVLGGDLDETHLGDDHGLSHGDIDGDGKSDIITGGPDYGFTGRGGVWIFEGPANGTQTVNEAETAIENDYGYYFFGYAVLGGYDGDRDGNEDVVATAPGVDFVGVFEGPTARTLSIEDVSSYWLEDGIGQVLGLAELDGDGEPDLLMGGLDVLYGAAGATRRNENTPTLTVDTEAAAMLVAFDADGDGLDEIALAGSTDTAGALQILPGGLSGSVTRADVVWSISAGRGELSGVVRTGDLNQDGHPDLAVGVDSRIVVLEGPLAGVTSVDDAAWEVTPERDETISGAFDILDDFDADGRPDLLVSQYGASILEVFLIPGPFAGGVSVYDATLEVTGATGDRTHSVDGVGDLDGDGTEDFAISQPLGGIEGHDEGGAIYLFRGGGL